MKLALSAVLAFLILQSMAFASSVDSLNVSLTIIPAVPQFSNIYTQPSSPSQLANGCNNHFYSAWDGSASISGVVFEFNFSNSTVVNYTALGSDGSYNYTMCDLPLGTYHYRWYSNSTDNLWNSTSEIEYRVVRYPYYESGFFMLLPIVIGAGLIMLLLRKVVAEGISTGIGIDLTENIVGYTIVVIITVALLAGAIIPAFA